MKADKIVCAWTWGDRPITVGMVVGAVVKRAMQTGDLDAIQWLEERGFMVRLEVAKEDAET